MASPNAEDVFLRIPARQHYAPIVGVGAAALGKRLGMKSADLDDLRLAMDRAMVMLLDGLKRNRKKDLHIDVVFRVVGNRFEFEASRSGRGGVSDKAVRLFADTTRELVDELRIDPDTGAIWLGKALADVR